MKILKLCCLGPSLIGYASQAKGSQPMPWLPRLYTEDSNSTCPTELLGGGSALIFVRDLNGVQEGPSVP
jgi:hypothetical protein